jgi:cyclohexanone monooxygenase
MSASESSAKPLDALVVGAGFSGLYQLYELRRRGYSVHLVEANAGPGGVWYANRYPGARVDSHVPNYEYSLEAVWRDWNWSERFPGGDELRRYFDHVVDVLDLTVDISFSTRVEGARFDEETRSWSVELSSAGETNSLVCRQLILCTGFASKAFSPPIEGLDRFAGPCHHTAHWPHDGVALDGKRVGVVGTGASGVQVVQEAAKVASEVYVFQRTPVTALPMQQQQITPEQAAASKADYPEIFVTRNTPPGSMHDMVRRGDSALTATKAERDAVFAEAWEAGGFHFWFATFADVVTDLDANRLAYDYWRDNTRARIEDPEVADLLAPMEPPYPFGTKRPSLEQGYYDYFNQDNVHLVDIKANPIASVDAHTVRCEDGQVYELDVLVLATGFDANTGGLTQIDVRGSDGHNLAERWEAGVDTTMGLAVSGFPNLLFLYGPQSPAAFCNGPTCAELQSQWVGDLFDLMNEGGLTRIESTAESDQAWSEHLDAVAEGSLLSKTDSWYMAANVPGKRRQLLNHPSSDAYLRALDRCAEAGYDRFTFD